MKKIGTEKTSAVMAEGRKKDSYQSMAFRREMSRRWTKETPRDQEDEERRREDGMWLE